MKYSTLLDGTVESVQRVALTVTGKDGFGDPVVTENVTTVSATVEAGGSADIPRPAGWSIKFTLYFPMAVVHDASDEWVVRGKRLNTVGFPRIIRDVNGTDALIVEVGTVEG